MSEQTRAIFFGFTVYNRNHHLVSIVEAVFEFPSGGAVVPSATVNTISVDPYARKTAAVVVISIMTVILLVAELVQVRIYLLCNVHFFVDGFRNQKFRVETWIFSELLVRQVEHHGTDLLFLINCSLNYALDIQQ